MHLKISEHIKYIMHIAPCTLHLIYRVLAPILHGMHMGNASVGKCVPIKEQATGDYELDVAVDYYHIDYQCQLVA